MWCAKCVNEANDARNEKSGVLPTLRDAVSDRRWDDALSIYLGVRSL